MRKLSLIFMTVILSVICMSVSAFASETCPGSEYMPNSDYETGMLLCDRCSEPVCMSCWRHEASCSCEKFDPYYCTYCGGAICECHSCGICGKHADYDTCRACGLNVYDCSCTPRSGECYHSLISDFYLDEDGFIESAVCYLCGETIPDFVGVPFTDDSFQYRWGYLYSSGHCSIHRGSLTYSMCEHVMNLSPDTMYLYIDQYGYLNGVCMECNIMANVNYLYGDYRTITGLTESDFEVLYDYLEFAEAFDFRIDSHDGFLTTRCACGWADIVTGDFDYYRYNGFHEVGCPECGGLYTGLYCVMDPETAVCSGDDCVLCLNADIKDYIPLADSKTLTDYVTDTGSILSNGLDMASTIAKTVTENPVLLLLYAIPFTAIAAIVFRKVKR